jgi:hypothetical protein
MFGENGPQTVDDHPSPVNFQFPDLELGTVWDSIQTVYFTVYLLYEYCISGVVNL